jgi:hypothetical protein
MKTIIQGINVEQIKSTLSSGSILDINYLKLLFLLKEE